MNWPDWLKNVRGSAPPGAAGACHGAKRGAKQRESAAQARPRDPEEKLLGKPRHCSGPEFREPIILGPGFVALGGFSFEFRGLGLGLAAAAGTGFVVAAGTGFVVAAGSGFAVPAGTGFAVAAGSRP